MELIAQTRKEFGKKTKKIRQNRQIPAVMFAKGIDSVPLTVDSIQFGKIFREAGETTLIDLKSDGLHEKVLIKDVQYDPVSSNPIHASFHKVNLKEKITAQIPVTVIGDEEHPLVKSGEAMVLTLMNEITVEALPTNLPHEITVDVAGLKEIDDSITVAELNINRENVEILGVEPEDLVVKLSSAQMAEEVEEEVELTEEEKIAQMQATEELTPEERAAREAEKAAEEEDKE